MLAVDSVKPQGVPALALDLKASSRKLVLDLVQSKRLAAVHLAPPCGTSSRAREIYAGPGCPQPLRSPLHADGLPGLSFLQRTRVSAANKLYRFTAEVIRACHSLGVLWSLENPHKPHAAVVAGAKGLYGGLRKKATTFWSSAPVVQSLSLRCHDGGPPTPSLGKARSSMDHSRGSSLPSGFVQTLGLHSLGGSEQIRTCRDSRQSTWHSSLRSRRACCSGPFSQGNARTGLRRSLSGTAMGQVCRRCRQNQVCPRSQAS